LLGSRIFTWRHGLAVGAVGAVGLVLAACTSGPSGPAATVDDVGIPREQLESWVQAAVQENPDLDTATLSADLLTGVILRHVVDGILAELGLVVDPELVAELRSEMEEERGGALALATTLAESGFSEAYFTEVFLPIEAGIETLTLTLGEQRTHEIAGLAVQSARVSVDPDIGVWDPGVGSVLPN
jgi:hypothetical protein